MEIAININDIHRDTYDNSISIVNTYFELVPDLDDVFIISISSDTNSFSTIKNNILDSIIKIIESKAFKPLIIAELKLGDDSLTNYKDDLFFILNNFVPVDECKSDIKKYVYNNTAGKLFLNL